MTQTDCLKISHEYINETTSQAKRPQPDSDIPSIVPKDTKKAGQNTSSASSESTAASSTVRGFSSKGPESSLSSRTDRPKDDQPMSKRMKLVAENAAQREK